ncbi:unnamed protein product, partial [Rotaria sordida]
NNNNNNFYQRLPPLYQVQPFSPSFNSSNWQDSQPLMPQHHPFQFGHCCICSAYRSHSCAGKF